VPALASSFVLNRFALPNVFAPIKNEDYRRRLLDYLHVVVVLRSPVVVRNEVILRFVIRVL
jgi:hypothetical protein